jgi:zinc protease
MGDFKPRRFEKRIRRHFGDFQPAPVNRVADSVILAPRFKRVELPRDVEQAFVCYGFTVCPARDKDFAALRVAAAVLGEGGSSRLSMRLREDKGLVYQVGATLAPRRNAGHLVIFAGAKPEAIDDRFLLSNNELVALRVGVKAGIQAEIEALQDANVPTEELERAQNYIIGKFRGAHQTNAGRVNHLGAFDQLGLGVNYDMLFPDLIRAVTARQVRYVARKYFTSPTIVAVRPQSENPNIEIRNSKQIQN